MVFLLPASPVHAATPTVSLSTISNGALTAVTSGTVGSTLVIKGTGFTPSAAIAISTTVGTSTTAWLTNGGCATTNGGTSDTTPAVDSLVSTSGTNNHCLITDALGNFAVEATVPALPGGAQTVSVTDGVNTATASLTITPSVTITYTGNNYGFPEEAISPTITVAGFGASESVTVSAPAWNTGGTTISITTTTTGSGTTSPAGVTVADTNGGTKTITATGGTSGLSASTTYTVNPWAAFYTATSGTGTQTVFSFQGTAPTSILVEAHGLPAGTMPANSITIGGVATSHASVAIGTSGAFGGVGNELVVAPSAQVPFGPVTVVIDGISFNYGAGNIASGAGTWGGALISSIQGTPSSTAVITTDAASYKPGGYAASTTSPAPQTSQVAVFGYGIVPGNTVGVTPPTGSPLAPITTHLIASASGAIFATYSLGDTPYSATATPTTAASYTIGIATTGTSNTLPPSYGIIPWAAAPTVTTVNFATSTSVTVHGFSATEIVAVKIGGVALGTASGTCTTGATSGSCTETGTAPDIAGGSQSVTATGASSGQTATDGTVTVDAIASSTSGQTILPDTGSAGTSVQIRTASTYGIHGLAANTVYNVVWNAVGGAITLGTFTSTATGGIPVPGVQFTVPSDSSGIHILDIQTASGASALFGSTVLGTTAQTILGYSTAYGDLLFSNTAALTASPSVASIGVPEVITGGGLTPSASYVMSLAPNPGTCTASTTQPALKQFTATASGTVPAGTAVTMTDTPTNTETGTVENFVVQTAADFGVNTQFAACAQFVLAASAQDNSTTEPAGHSVTMTAHGLNGGGATYNIVFNYALNALGSGYTGTTVGVLAPSTTGAATATWTVPAGTASGTYTVQLVVSTQGTNGLAAGKAALNVPLSITVGSVNTSSCNTTSCMSSTGSTTTQIGPSQAIQTSFSNTSTAPVTAVVFAVVHNALGQTVSYSTATVTASAGGSATAYNVLYGLAPGTYSVTIFATSTSGTAISNTSTVSVTIS